MALNSKHEHQFNAWELEPINVVQKLYQGTPGDKAFIFRKCATCPARVYCEYGNKSEMETKLWELVAAIK